MAYKRRFFNDKTIVAAAAVGVLTVSAIVGGALLGGEEPKNNSSIVDLSDDNGVDVSEQDDVKAENTGNEAPTDSADLDNIEGEGQEVADNTSQLDEERGSTTPETESADTPSEEIEESDAASGLVGVNFDAASTIIWPVEGNILIDYDMENTVYFATIDLYKCSDAVCVQSEVGTPVYAGHACVVEEIAYNSEIGNNVTVSMGNGYMLTYGQLKDVQIEKGATVEEGDLIGYIGTPTKYYSVEGSHLYMKMTKDGSPIDPLDYLNYEE